MTRRDTPPERTRLITIRLGRGLLKDLKAIAKMRGVKYQPLIKRVLQREAKAMKATASPYDCSANPMKEFPGD